MNRRIHTTAFIIFGLMVLLGALSLSMNGTFTVFCLLDNLPIAFRSDELSRFFFVLVTAVWALVLIYSFGYMDHEENQIRFYIFFDLSYLVFLGFIFSANLVTMYIFFELLTLSTFPLVFHSKTHEAVMASLKYLLYSISGAYVALFGIFMLYTFNASVDFAESAGVNIIITPENRTLILVAILALIVGFGVKAGMFPLHAWLPTAHPVAPTPASAILSGVIVKAGIFAIIRCVYYLAGAEEIRGTFVQRIWMLLSLITVFMGSMLAYREPVLKKRLAYSSVSQLSYIMLGLACLSPRGISGALLHTAFHAVIKSGLFMTAGILLLMGKRRAEDMEGFGSRMPGLMLGFGMLALALTGIPPTAGFVSKWELCQAALETGMPVFSYLAPAVLLISALLTAGYLLKPTLRAFFTTEDKKQAACAEDKKYRLMVAVVVMCGLLAVAMGIFASPIIRYTGELADTIVGGLM